MHQLFTMYASSKSFASRSLATISHAASCVPETSLVDDAAPSWNTMGRYYLDTSPNWKKQ